jgi:Ca-activated chloride channel family protein
MRRILLSFTALLLLTNAAPAQGLLIPRDVKQAPLTMASHDVKVSIEDQVAVTTVEQVFRNNSGRELEATYIFPVPRGASVRKFSMWVNGREEKGELLESAKAKQIYNDIVRRTRDPGLLEYVGNDLLQVRVFPVPPQGDQKISLTFTSVAPMDSGLVEYTYPLKVDTRANRLATRFSLQVQLKAQNPIQNIYSPTHNVALARPNDREALITVERDQIPHDRDFQLFYNSAARDVGLTALMHRPGNDNGYFMMLISPRAELSRSQEVPRDMVFVLDTSGSMRGRRIEQARNAMKFCLDRLTDRDRFAVIHFATTVTKFNDNLKDATPHNIADARKWVDSLEANGSTAINDALLAALQMRPGDRSRPFTVVFFTDGQPTVGETNPTKIVANVMAQNSGNTRIFTFGVGDDVNAALLDQLADKTRAYTTYVRETENIEAKVSGLYAKISSPVLTDLKLTVGDGVRISEVYPPNLPDLFHGSQLVVLGRYQGSGKVSVKLAGQVGKEPREFVHDLTFAERTTEDKSFVEDLWARRKVGFVLDQIRLHGENKELVDDVIFLAKRYGITTPYTSYLVVPDAMPGFKAGAGAPPRALGGFGKAGGGGGKGAKGGAKVEDFAKSIAGDAKGLDKARAELAKDGLKDAAKAGDKDAANQLSQLSTFERAEKALQQKQLSGVQQGALGVDVAIQVNNYRNQQQVSPAAVQRIASRNLVDVGGVWIDDAFDAKMKTVNVKAQSDAYFSLLERQPSLRDLLRLGNHLVYVLPNGEALIIDAQHGVETLTDAEIDRLFVPTAKK